MGAPMAHDPIKVCLFSGFLGSGKTTILQRILGTLPAGERVRIIVNDLSRDNIDVDAFPSSQPGQSPSYATTQVSALSGGCICCNLLADLVKELQSAHRQGYTYVFVECTGVADPVPIVATLHALPDLQGCVEVDAMVTVVGAASLLSATSDDHEHISFASLDAMQGDQIKGANVVLINNWEYTDLIDPALMRLWVRHIKEFCRDSNPKVRVFCTNKAHIAFDALVYRRSLFASDNVAPYFLRAFLATGKTIGEYVDPSEEAGELQKLGLQHFTLEAAGEPYSTAQLRRSLSTRAARQLLTDVWRSKGYFFAVDDENGVSDGAAVTRQFRWQTVGRKVDYGEVLPPQVPLVDPLSGQPLRCRIVFIGNFNASAKAEEARRFFVTFVSPSG